MRFAPKPGVHPAHGCSHHHPRVIHAEAVGQQLILRFHHVGITVARKFRVQSIARLTRFAVANSIRQHDEIFRRVERLIFTEKFAGKFRSNELRAATGRSVHDQHGVREFALDVIAFAERSVMNSQLGQALSRREFEIVDRVIALVRRRIIHCRD